MPDYTAFGLTISSDMLLPQLLPGTGPVDVTIRWGKTPPHLDHVAERGVLYEANATEFLLTVADVASYLVQNGRDIIVERHPHADDSSIQLFLLGSAMGALLHQRGLLPIHGSALETPAGAILFSGVSGAGKSTTAAAFLRRGYRLLADDVCAVECGNESGPPLVYPGYPQQKLWADTLEHLQTNADDAGFKRVRPQLNKFAVPTPEMFCNKPLPLRVTYVLVRSNQVTEPEIHPLDGIWRLRALKFQVYRQRFMDKKGATVRHAQQFAALANHVRVCRVVRPEHPFMLDELADLIEQDFQALSVTKEGV